MSSQGSTGDIRGREADNGADIGKPRRIVHVDMDAFYASIEQPVLLVVGLQSVISKPMQPRQMRLTSMPIEPRVVYSVVRCT